MNLPILTSFEGKTTMLGHSSRRGFLRETALVAAGAVGGLVGGLMPLSSPAIEPIRRNGRGKFKFSMAAYSYRDFLTGKTEPKLSLDDFIADCATMQLEGTELTSYYFPTPVTDEYLRHLKQLCFRLGLDISGTAIGNDFCYPAGPERDKQIADVKKWIEHAEILGAPVIRVFSGNSHGQSSTEAHQLAVQGMEECCHYAGEHGVFLALENHGGLTSKVADMMALVRDVKSPWFGVNVDTGNFHSEDIYGDLAQIAPFAMNVQVKVMISGPDGKKRPSDFKRLAQLLGDAGYRGYIVLEFEEPEDPRQACSRYMEQIREAFSAWGQPAIDGSK
jgi:sugar phosphate isomerase/epimerase